MKTPARVSHDGKNRKIQSLDPFLLTRLFVDDMLPDPALRKKVTGLVRQRNVSSLAELGAFQDKEYHNPEDVWSILVLRQVAALFKKNDAFVDDDKCSAAAQKTFERSERICRIANKRLDYFFSHRGRLDPELDGWLGHMESDIVRLLGDTRSFIESVPDLLRVTNGATQDRSRKRSLPYLKITGKLRAPRATKPWLDTLLRFFGVEETSCKFVTTEENRVALVPKNWKTHRTIAAEPTHSLPFQLAVDQWFKAKLKRWGVDLRSQALNQQLAREGSLSGQIATIDLSMASDTLAYNAVAWLLPHDWLRVLDSFRSRGFIAPWGQDEYAKYSSMGNGYTFSLETIIFTAACRAVGSRRHAVYGDDIAIETVYVPNLVRLLRFLGFRVNEEKSFSNPASRFRESCGCDYYKGELVTPFYLREIPQLGDRAGMSHALNGLLSLTPAPGGLWSYLREIIAQERYRLVPWNEDSRSGVFITPNDAWKTKKLKIDRRRRVKGAENENFGFPIFEGYGPVQVVKKTKGWRSYLLWFLEKNYKGKRASGMVPKRMTAYLLSMSGNIHSHPASVPEVSSVGLGCRYVHKTCRFDPKPLTTPSRLYLLSRYLLGTDDPL